LLNRAGHFLIRSLDVNWEKPLLDQSIMLHPKRVENVSRYQYFELNVNGFINQRFRRIVGDDASVEMDRIWYQQS